MSKTSVLFVNHASLLIKSGDHYLLTDPWFEKPAFGSWLPSHPMTVHPVYLAALDNLSILISHGHDDHCDDDVLRLFDKATPIVTAFPLSIGERLNWFKDIRKADNTQIGDFIIKSYFHQPKDAVYTIETPDALIIHANDNWDMSEEALEAIKSDVERIGAKRTLYCSQVGSASGWPLNYRCYSDEEKQDLLRLKIGKMATIGSDNAKRLGLDNFAAYAGYALPFVEGKDYIDQGIVPTPINIRAIAPKAHIMGFYPGDIYDFETPIRRPMFNNRSGRIAEKAERYYRLYDKAPKHNCSASPNFEDQLNQFISAFNDFASPVKMFKVIMPGEDRVFSFRKPERALKVLSVKPHLMEMVVNGELLFESLYTGYLGEWERDPKDQYNEDIVNAIVAFSYVWQAKARKVDIAA